MQKKFSCLTLLLIQIVVLVSLLSNSSVLAVTINRCPPGMVFIPGGTFNMGADSLNLVVERSLVKVNSFCIDKYEVTNKQFAEFVKATNYLTVAERLLSKEQFPDLPDEQRLPGSLVFYQPKEGLQPVEFLSWWRWTTGANWQHPFGVGSSITEKDNYPVVHIAYEDALAYAKWAGKFLPTEAQWEYAARGGLDNATYTWGNKYSEKKANTWQGIFPFVNTKADGYIGTAEVGSFPANGYGLYDMAGNVWEWTSDLFGLSYNNKDHRINPTAANTSFVPEKPGKTTFHAIKGGSYLCAPNYCSRYRPAARESQSTDTGTTHIGFRLVKNLAKSNLDSDS